MDNGDQYFENNNFMLKNLHNATFQFLTYGYN
jgi:hypothetical protein